MSVIRSIQTSTVLFVLALFALSGLPGCGGDEHAHDHDHDHDHAHHDHGRATARTAATGTVSDPYFLAGDPVTDEPLGDSPVKVMFAGRELRFANQANADTFAAAPEQYIAAVDQKMIAAQLSHYPLTTCVVAEKSKLGSMGEPVNHLHGNRLVRFCCAGCTDAFTKDPAKHIARVDAAVIAAQQAGYPFAKCLVSDEAMDANGGPTNRVIANRLFRLCCAGCDKALQANPAKFIAQLDAAKPAGS